MVTAEKQMGRSNDEEKEEKMESVTIKVCLLLSEVGQISALIG